MGPNLLRDAMITSVFKDLIGGNVCTLPNLLRIFMLIKPIFQFKYLRHNHSLTATNSKGEKEDWDSQLYLPPPTRTSHERPQENN